MSQDHSHREAGTVVLIHGLWLTPLVWEHWKARYESIGFRVLTPGYPGIEQGEAGVAALRDDPSPLARLGVREVASHLIEFVSALDAPPILIGHSYGGAFVQLLLDAGYGAAGVAIHSAPVKGVTTMPMSALKAGLRVLANPRNRHRAIPPSAAEFREVFGRNLTPTAARAAYDRYGVPLPGRMMFQGALANFTRRASTTVEFTNSDRAPLLFISGDKDQILPPSVQKANYRLHERHSRAITAYLELPGRSHFTCGEPGWEEIADLALNWSLDPHSVYSGSETSNALQ